MSGFYQGFPGVRGVYTPPVTDKSQFLIYPHYIDVSAVDYWFHTPNHDDKTKGLAWQLQRVSGDAGSTVRVINDAFESAMRPGVVFPFAPDVTSGTVTTYTESNVQYKTIADGSSYAEWLVPAFFTGAIDKIIYFPYDNSTTFDLIRNRGGSTTTVASGVTPNSSYLNPGTVTLSATLVAGDYLRWKRAAGAGNCRVASMQGYDSTGSCTDTAQHFIPATPAILGTSVWMASSSMEGAFEISPTGSALEFVGGAAHQGPVGTFGQEHPNTETWTKGGTSWTPAGGMWLDLVQMTRVSTIYYNGGNTNIGTLTTAYTFKSTALCTQTSLTSNGAVDVGSVFFTMLPTNCAGTTTAGIALSGSSKEELATSGTGSDQTFTAPRGTTSPAVFYTLQTPLGGSLCAYSECLNGDTITSRTVEPKGGNKVKLYSRTAPSTQSNVTGVSHSGYSCWWLDSSTGPTSYGRQ